MCLCPTRPPLEPRLQANLANGAAIRLRVTWEPRHGGYLLRSIRLSGCHCAQLCTYRDRGSYLEQTKCIHQCEVSATEPHVKGAGRSLY